jgi:alkylated DNA repair dioxygenase AlkB
MDCSFDGSQNVSYLGSGDSFYYANFITNPDEGFQQLQNQVIYLPREELTFKIYGKTFMLPRDKQFYGDIAEDGTVPLYRYSGNYVPQLKDWVPVLKNIRDLIYVATKQYCNHAVVNRYLVGSDHIGFHRDKDRDFVENSSILTLSFGQPRLFTLKNNTTNITQKIILQPGSLMILGPKTNNEWKHSIPKRSSKDINNVRISVTLRSIKTRYNPTTKQIY